MVACTSSRYSTSSCQSPVETAQSVKPRPGLPLAGCFGNPRALLCKGRQGWLDGTTPFPFFPAGSKEGGFTQGEAVFVV